MNGYIQAIKSMNWKRELIIAGAIFAISALFRNYYQTPDDLIKGLLYITGWLGSGIIFAVARFWYKESRRNSIKA